MSLELKAGLVEIDVHESMFLEEWAICIWLSLLSPSHISLRPFLLDVLCKYTRTQTCIFYNTCVDVREQLEEACPFHHVGSRDEVK